MKTIQNILILIIIYSLFACNHSSKKKGNTNSKPPTVVIQKLTKVQAIQNVQYHISNSRKTVMVQTHYYDNVRKRKPCTQYDVDLNRSCSGIGVGAPYGYRTVTERVRKCCQQKSKRISSIQGKWEAIYEKSSDQWKVELEFKDDKKEAKYLTWFINDKNKKVTDRYK